ncbi:hypothetical protein Tco_1457975 [Tanacetum coccineum]
MQICPDYVLNWMAFGGNTRDLGSFGEETDEITDIHQILEEVLLTERGDGVASIKRHRYDLSGDGVWTYATASQQIPYDNRITCIAATIIEDRDAFRSEVPDLVSHEFYAQAPKIIKDLFKNYVQSNVIQVHPTTTTSTETISSATLQQQLYFKMKRSLQDQANDPVL